MTAYVREMLAAGQIPWAIGAVVLGLVAMMGWVSFLALFGVWAERKVSAGMQVRLGPMHVGPHGALQTIADAIKLALKEDLRPKGSDSFLHLLAPILVFGGTFASFVAIPFASGLYVTDLDLGVYFIVGIASLEIVGVVMAGWASNNKWSLLGAMREAAQVVAYEIPLGLSLLAAILTAGTLSLRGATEAQAGFLFQPFANFYDGGGWLVFRHPFLLAAFVIFFLAGLASAKRAPFDLPEAESELVAGFHTEYSGMRWSFFFLEEYARMFLVAAVGTCFFLGGWHVGIPLFGLEQNLLFSAAVFVTKCFALCFLMMWLRWTLPRFRIDQVLGLGYKVLTPFAFACVLGTSLLEFF